MDAEALDAKLAEINRDLRLAQAGCADIGRPGEFERLAHDNLHAAFIRLVNSHRGLMLLGLEQVLIAAARGDDEEKTFWLARVDDVCAQFERMRRDVLDMLDPTPEQGAPQ